MASRAVRGLAVATWLLALAATWPGCAASPARPQLAVRVRTPGAPSRPPAGTAAGETSEPGRVRATGEPPPPSAPLTSEPKVEGTLE